MPYQARNPDLSKYTLCICFTLRLVLSSNGGINHLMYTQLIGKTLAMFKLYRCLPALVPWNFQKDEQQVLGKTSARRLIVPNCIYSWSNKCVLFFREQHAASRCAGIMVHYGTSMFRAQERVRERCSITAKLPQGRLQLKDYWATLAICWRWTLAAIFRPSNNSFALLYRWWTLCSTTWAPLVGRPGDLCGA